MSNEIKVLDHGIVSLLGSFGNDETIADTARVSHGGADKQREWPEGKRKADRDLIRYLMRHHHCYHPDMEVLTSNGWKKWKNCQSEEYLAVPNPDSRTFRWELLSILSFKYKGKLNCHKHQRMSYQVTPDHRMWFKWKHQQNFAIERASELRTWGHFDSLVGYTIEKDGCWDWKYWLLGFYLGDGHSSSTNVMSFHLVKKRKIEKLRECLTYLHIPWKEQPGAKPTSILIKCPKFAMLRDLNLNGVRCQSKSLPEDFVRNLNLGQAQSLWDGLIDSDGHRRPKRHQIRFSSTSDKLLEQFAAISHAIGCDCHGWVVDKKSPKGNVTKMVSGTLPGTKCTLESRMQYKSIKNFDGKVYCATSSTGLLMVRGNKLEFGFVCGNSSPFEFVQFRFFVRAPIFVYRQWHRHRVFSYNEMSGRYSTMPFMCYVPESEQITKQSSSNKQGGSEQQIDSNLYHKIRLSNEQKEDRQNYEERLESGMRKELARINLPLSQYSDMYWSADLHNLFHFLKLRLDAHAQWEIRQYAQAILELIEPVVPLAVEAWRDYVLEARSISRLDLVLFQDLIDNRVQNEPAYYGMSKREFDECISLFNHIKSLDRDKLWYGDKDLVEPKED